MTDHNDRNPVPRPADGDAAAASPDAGAGRPGPVTPARLGL
jgi:hypothetical protein